MFNKPTYYGLTIEALFCWVKEDNPDRYDNIVNGTDIDSKYIV